MNLRRILGRIVTPPLIAGILAIHLDGCAETVPQGPRAVDLRSDAAGRFYFIAPGSEIEITRRDGVLLRGRLRGTQRMSAEQYAAHRGARASAPGAGSSPLPAPGDTIEIHPRVGSPYTARFSGFSLGGIEVGRDSSIVTLAYLDLAEVQAGGWTRKSSELGWDAVGGRLPLTTLLRVGVASGEVTVPADEVGEVRVPGGTQSSGSGVGTGAAIVAGVLVAAVFGAFLALYIIGHSIDEGCGSFPFGWSPMLDPSDLPRGLPGPATLPDSLLLASRVQP